MRVELVGVLSPRPGEIIVARVSEGGITAEAVHAIADSLKQAFPDNRVVAIEGDMELSAVPRSAFEG